MTERRFLPCINPATGKEFGRVPVTEPGEVERAMCDARRNSSAWSGKTVHERVRILRRLQIAVVDLVDEISEVISKDTGKSRQDAMIEVYLTLDLLHAYLKHAPRWLRTRRVPRSPYFLKKSYYVQKPYGVVAVISPWNYPFALALPPVLAALLAGNSVLLKPSEVTAATGVMIEKIFQCVPDLSRFVRVLHGDADTGAALVAAKPDYIFLTGSTSTGKAVMRAAAEHLIPVACELGGKDAMLVLEDADLDSAAKWGLWGAMYNTGQACMSVERVYVVEGVYDQFIQKVLSHLQQYRLGYSDDKDSPYHLGPISDPRQVGIILDQLEDARKKGARVLAGGGINEPYLDPVILVDVDHSMHVMQEETFGPLLPVMKVKDEAEAIRMANDSEYGLGASVWSSDIGRAERVAHKLDSSTVIVNDAIAHFAIPMLPFGGVKSSGSARIHGMEGLLQFTRPFSYAIGDPPKSWDFVTIMRYPGHYQVGVDVLRLLFGVTLRRRLRPVKERLLRNRI
jgi:acyl-CoA reductase-like NAD-dependent aldehyde dehydrogenase